MCSIFDPIPRGQKKTLLNGQTGCELRIHECNPISFLEVQKTILSPSAVADSFYDVSFFHNLYLKINYLVHTFQVTLFTRS